jgi:putative ABC transport system permease protein
MLDDLRLAMRTLLHARGFTVAALLTLGLGMGANATVFGVVDALLLRPLPFGERSGRLVTLHSTHPTQAQDWDDSDLSYPDLVDIREGSTTLDGVEGLVARNVSLTGARETERVQAASVTPGLFDLLGVAPQLGRAFRTDEGAAIGLESVAIISHSLWQRLFGGDPAILQKTVPLNGRTLAIVGVMPAGFAFPELHEIWLPYGPDRTRGRNARSLTTVALVKDGTSLQAARAELNRLGSDLAARYPQTNRDWNIHALPMRDFFVSDALRNGLTAMFVAVALVLLVACANVGSLLLARGIGRQRELTLRTALGAGRSRILRMLLAESVLLSAIGGLLAFLLASWGLDALIASNPEPPPYWARPAVDSRVVGFCVLLALVAAIGSGLLPALRATRVDIGGGTLQSNRTTGATLSQRRLQGALVAAQVALSFALLVGATLLARSTAELQRADAGFDPAPVLSGRMYIAGDAYDDPKARAAIVDRLVQRLASLPGVQSASATGAIPGDDGGDGIMFVPDSVAAAPGEGIGGQLIPMSGRLFETLGLSLIEGRSFTAAETNQPDADVAIVNARLAQRYWPGQSALGRTLRIGAQQETSLRVVGVVPDLVYEELGEESAQSRLNIYVPYARAGWRSMAILVRTPNPPGTLAGSLRATVREVDPAFAAFDVMTMSERRLFTTWGERFIGRTFAFFAGAALLLACIGAYGLTAYSAAQRVREIGVRIAVGATRGDIIRLLLGRGVRLAAIGALAGLPLALASARLVEGLLFQVSPWDPRVWTVLPIVLFGMVLVASFVPAHRASLTDPSVTLRQE